MPRGPRLDAPGVLYHVMARGIKQRRIFQDDHHRDDFVDRLAGLVKDTALSVCAWVLIGNHLPLLVHTEQRQLSHSRGSRLTGY